MATGTGFSNYLETQILNATLRNTAYTPPTTVYAALLTALADGEAGTVAELTGGSYARQSAAFAAPSGGSVANSGAINYTNLPASPGTTLGGAMLVGDTTLTVASATGFPTVNGFKVKIDNEVLLVTAGAGTTSWTVTRAQEGTAAAAHASGAAVFGTIGYVGLYDALTSGNLLYYSTLTASRSATAGDGFAIAAGALTVSLD